MLKHKITSSERRATIVALLREHGHVKTDHLAGHFRVSLQTIRRDLNYLAAKHEIRRDHGGAKLIAFDSGLNPNVLQVFDEIISTMDDFSKVFIDSNVFIKELTTVLRKRSNLYISTTSVDVIYRLRDSHHLQLFYLGGRVDNKASQDNEFMCFQSEVKDGYDFSIIDVDAVDDTGAVLVNKPCSLYLKKKAMLISKKSFLLNTSEIAGNFPALQVGRISDNSEVYSF
ncbi:DeoR family transcriptional regulator [Photobacterium rosenbergii]|uniref:DeoR family transcriptional regulator n=1 Tax=Photobacterium rosenbergii TaxID=294936 RepID=A0ABU3ZI46_9GAMM|nr:DeoR family transcriptional regulator [Photobacterium rosenbergii]MDV5169803.1 DeoR family transcriptional regulator [Photobacterium rosenbergii]